MGEPGSGLRPQRESDAETTSIVRVVTTSATMVRPVSATLWRPSMEEPTMTPPNRKRRSNETVQSSAPKRRLTNNDPSPPGASVNVTLRERILSESEAEITSIVHVVDDRCHVFDSTAEAEPFFFQGQWARASLVKPNKDQTFMLDHFFDETNGIVYLFDTPTKDMLTALLEGCNSSVFADIATGAGNTIAVLGSEECPVVDSRTAIEWYERVDKHRVEGQTFDVAVAYSEASNKVVRHLLCPDLAKAIAISNLTIHKVTEGGSLFELLLNANKKGTQYATDANATPSWSHANFQICATQTDNATNMSKEIRLLKIGSVELARSEGTVAVRWNIKHWMSEGMKLHMSFLVLANCIDTLSKNGMQQTLHRASKLTHILKDSLGSSSSTLIIAAVTLRKLSYTDTYNIVMYAERAI
ncbi:kinesin-like protein KIF18A [Dermacentor andersoni]|uniref:kinesin-like protein KIF18A n=1 Tax=Dermacentor andersoni TaxID=34620 RepID=UPI002155AF23|nr:kinesin-like protein KIF18A [Dermacentor andersoni]